MLLAGAWCSCTAVVRAWTLLIAFPPFSLDISCQIDFPPFRYNYFAKSKSSSRRFRPHHHHSILYPIVSPPSVATPYYRLRTTISSIPSTIATATSFYFTFSLYSNIIADSYHSQTGSGWAATTEMMTTTAATTTTRY